VFSASIYFNLRPQTTSCFPCSFALMQIHNANETGFESVFRTELKSIFYRCLPSLQEAYKEITAGRVVACNTTVVVNSSRPANENAQAGTQHRVTKVLAIIGRALDATLALKDSDFDHNKVFALRGGL
jgi:hypothetical protein